MMMPAATPLEPLLETDGQGSTPTKSTASSAVTLDCVDEWDFSELLQDPKPAPTEPHMAASSSTVINNRVNNSKKKLRNLKRNLTTAQATDSWQGVMPPTNSMWTDGIVNTPGSIIGRARGRELESWVSSFQHGQSPSDWSLPPMTLSDTGTSSPPADLLTEDAELDEVVHNLLCDDEELDDAILTVRDMMDEDVCLDVCLS